MRELATAATLFLFIACGNTDKTQAFQPNHLSEPIKIDLPKTPETVVRTWEEKINKNDFTFARLISAGNTLDFVNSLAISKDIEQSADIHSEVMSIKCVEKGNTAICDCILKDAYGKTAFKYNLVFNSGQWLITDVVPDAEQPPIEQMTKKPTTSIQ
jgi:hypothetical protein